jgi:hypothetical protein
MKLFSVSLVLFFQLIISSCMASHERDTALQLESPRLIQGVLCKDFAGLYPNGSLRYCRLAEAQPVAGITLPANTTVYFHPDSTIKHFFLDGPALVNGYLLKGSGNNWMHTVHTNGSLKLIWLEKDEVINGIPCRAATFWRDVFGGAGTHLHSDGKVARCRLAGDLSIDGKNFKKGEELKIAADKVPVR